MDTTFAPVIPRDRFARLLADTCEKPAYDRVIAEFADCVMAPTLGSIIPNWLLIIPRHKQVNFRKWARASLSPYELIAGFLAQLGIQSERAIWFEHGASQEGTTIGCGVDHAHIHLLIDAPFSFGAFSLAAQNRGTSRWTSTSSEYVYKKISPSNSYLAMGSEDEAVFCEKVEAIGSQFLRRVVAQLVGSPDSWDYKEYPHYSNVLLTLQNFGTRHDAPRFGAA